MGLPEKHSENERQYINEILGYDPEWIQLTRQRSLIGVIIKEMGDRSEKDFQKALPSRYKGDHKWTTEFFIPEHLPMAILWAGIIFDHVIPEEYRQKIYHPKNADHGTQHALRGLQNTIMAMIYTSEFKGLSMSDRENGSLSITAVMAFHDLLQPLSILPDNKKRLGHDEIAGRFLVPGLMILANKLGLTAYSSKQIALAAALVFNHELEHNDVGINLPSEKVILKKYEGKEYFGRRLTEVFPILGWLKLELAKQGVDLFNLSLDFSGISSELYENAHSIVVAGDSRDQIAPPYFAAKRTLGARRSRLFADLSLVQTKIQAGPEINQYSNYEAFIDFIVAYPGYDPYNPLSKEQFPKAPATPNDDLARAAYEVCRSYAIKLPSMMLAWAKDSQMRRGDYQILLAEDLVAISQGNSPPTTNKKMLELAREVETELSTEKKIKYNDLTGTLTTLITEFDIKKLLEICDSKEPVFKCDNKRLQSVGELIIREYAETVKLLFEKFQTLKSNENFDAEQFIQQNRAVIEYAQTAAKLNFVWMMNPVITRIANKLRKVVYSFIDVDI